MITRNYDTLMFKVNSEEIEILDFIESRGQLFELNNIIQQFLDQRKRQREYDLKVDLRKLMKDTESIAKIDQIIQEFKNKQIPNG